MGFPASHVVHDYGDVCQAITGLAVEKKATTTTEEFHTLNRCLDTAIELRNQVQTALLSFQVLKAGTVGVGGSTGAVLGRSLIGLREIIDSTLSEVRLSATPQQRDRVSLLVFVDEVAVAANLHAEYRDIQLTVEAVDPALVISVGPQLLASALMNLLHNAFKYTHAKGRAVRTRAENGRVFIEFEDECGGLQENDADLVRPWSDRSGLGLGLSINRKAVTANGGEIHTRNVAGKGCIFTIELPQASPPSNEPGQMKQARDDTKTAQQGKEVADARLAYSKKLATSQAAQVTAAERKVDLMTEKVNLAKLQALDDAAVPAAGKYDRATAMQRVVDAQRAYDGATTTAAKASGEATTAKEHWQELAHRMTCNPP